MTSLPFDVTPLTPGDQFAGYTIVRELGAGGMGNVYLAHHPALKKNFALKVLSIALRDNPTFESRFRREMEIVSRLDHPNIVSTTDGGVFDGRAWFTMTYVEGDDAQKALVNHPAGLPAVDAVGIVGQVAEALDYSHDLRIVHGDVKPANILLAKSRRRVLLTDFGIAKATDDVRSLTTSQRPITIDFASPEQLAGEALDGRADVYSLGATLYALLTGSVPFPGPIAVKVSGHVSRPPPEPSRAVPGLTTAFDAVIATAMAKNPQDRYRTCGDLARAAQKGLVQSVAPVGRTTAPELNRPTRIEATGASPSRNPATVVKATGSVASTEERPPPSRPRRWARWPTVVASVIATLLIAGLLAWFIPRANSDPSSSAPSATTPSTPTTPPIPTSVTLTTPVTAESAGGPGPTTPPSAPGITASPLQVLLLPKPQQSSGTISGSPVNGASYSMATSNCPGGDRTIRIDTSQPLRRITGNLQLDDAAPPSTRTAFSIEADGVEVKKAVLSPDLGTAFDIDVEGVAVLTMTLKTLGQGSCDSKYLVFLTSSLAYPQKS